MRAPLVINFLISGIWSGSGMLVQCFATLAESYY